MSRRKLTPQEKELFVSMLDHSSGADRWRIFWWGIWSRRKQWALMDCLWDGMNLKAAMKSVRENPPKKG